MPISRYIPPKGHAGVEDTVALVVGPIVGEKSGELARILGHNTVGDNNTYFLRFSDGRNDSIDINHSSNSVSVYLRPNRREEVQIAWGETFTSRELEIRYTGDIGAKEDLEREYRQLFGEEFS